MKRLRMVWVAVLFLAPLMASGQDRAVPLKAAYIYYFTKFVYWPDDKVTRTICLRNNQPGLLAELEKVQQKSGNALTLAVFEQWPVTGHCDLLFLSAADTDLHTTAPATLIVSDTGLDRPDAVVALVLDGARLSFDIHLPNARERELEISAKLLSLAREVHR